MSARLRPRPRGDDPMAARVNLDALVPREAFEVLTAGIEAPIKQSIQLKADLILRPRK